MSTTEKSHKKFENASVRMKIKQYFKSLLRRKPFIPHDKERKNEDGAIIFTQKLYRSLTVLEVTFYILANMVGGGLLGLPVTIMALYSGPSLVISTLITGFVAYLNALCYGELATYLPHAGSAYAFTYSITGEIFGFLVGWVMALEYLLSTIFCTLGIANTIDAMVNGAYSDAILKNVGKLTTEHVTGYLSEYPNFLSMGFAIILIAFSLIRNRESFRIIAVLMTIFFIGVTISVIFMFVDGGHKEYLDDKDHNGFCPHGYLGIFTGAAILFNSFNGFDAVLSHSEEIENPAKVLPRAMTYVVVASVFLTTILSFALILYVPWWKVDPENGIAGIFIVTETDWMKYLSGVTTICGYFCCGFCNTSAVTRVLFSLSRDGFLPKCFQCLQKSTKIPVVAILIYGVPTVVFACILDYVGVSSMLTLGSLIVYTIVAVNVLLVRFTRPEVYICNNSNKIDVNVGMLWPNMKSCLSCFKSCPPGRVTVICTIIFCLFSFIVGILFRCTSAISHAIDPWVRNPSIPIWLIIIEVILCVVLILLVLLIASHRFQMTTTGYSCPGMPYVPLMAIISNIIISISLSGLVWIRGALWILAGLVIYLAYGYFHSKMHKKESTPKSPYILNDTIQNVIPKTQAVDSEAYNY